MLFKGCDPDARLWEMLQRDDCVLTWQDHTYFLGDLVAHGTHLDNAFNDQSRYWSEHAQILLLCLAGMLIPEPCFELRLVTALPVSLCDGERRERVRGSLSQQYHFSLNGSAREVVVKCGYVAMEGQGILIHCGDDHREQAVIDIGERTTNLVAASGQWLIGRLCKSEQVGVGNLVEALQGLYKDSYRSLSVKQAHALLQAYAHHLPYPKIRTALGPLPDRVITSTIERAIQSLTRPLASYLSGTWNAEDAPAGSQFDVIYLGGGGAYYFEDVVRAALPNCHIVTIPHPQEANLRGYAKLAAEVDEERWQVS